MQKAVNIFMVVFVILLGVALLVGIVTTVVGFSGSFIRNYEYEAMRKEFDERLSTMTKERDKQIAELTKRFEDEAYLNKRRYDLLQEELIILRKDIPD